MQTITEQFEEGRLILIDKPLRWTSAGVVARVKHVTGAKTGHAGTLDPLASGLLICCTGKWTKKINDYMSQEKEYTGTFTLGATTASYDLETEPEHFRPYDIITQADVDAVANRFTGSLRQIPPNYSAIKKNGHRAYDLMRRGKAVQLDARPVEIREFHMEIAELPLIRFRVTCSTGTYIRSLAHDVGAALGCGAYLSRLVRTRIGAFSLDQALTPEAWAATLAAAFSGDGTEAAPADVAEAARGNGAETTP